jgi:hypothetical protein
MGMKLMQYKDLDRNDSRKKSSQATCDLTGQPTKMAKEERENTSFLYFLTTVAINRLYEQV